MASVLTIRAKELVAMVILALVLVSGCWQKPAKPFQRTELLMDTVVTIKYYDPADEEAVEAAFTEMQRIEKLMSAHLPGSEVSRINASPGTPVAVSPETFQVIEESLRYAQLTDGVFDVSIGSLVELWSIMDGDDYVPAPSEIRQARALVDYRAVELNPKEWTVTLRRPGMRLDLGGVAKGYAIDRVRQILEEYGVKAALVDAGGDVWAVGMRPDGKEFRIGIRHPREPQSVVAVIMARDISIVTSGDYQRYFIKGGVRYHHIIDPRTGMPANSGVISVTIVSPSGMEGDILSTAVFILGKEAGLELIESLPGVEALVVTEDLQVLYTSGLEGRVEMR